MLRIFLQTLLLVGLVAGVRIALMKLTFPPDCGPMIIMTTGLKTPGPFRFFPHPLQFLLAPGVEVGLYAFGAIVAALLIGGAAAYKNSQMNPRGVTRYSLIHLCFICAAAGVFFGLASRGDFNEGLREKEWLSEILTKFMKMGSMALPVAYGALLGYTLNRLRRCDGKLRRLRGIERYSVALECWILGINPQAGRTRSSAPEQTGFFPVD